METKRTDTLFRSDMAILAPKVGKAKNVKMYQIRLDVCQGRDDSKGSRKMYPYRQALKILSRAMAMFGVDGYVSYHHTAKVSLKSTVLQKQIKGNEHGPPNSTAA